MIIRLLAACHGVGVNACHALQHRCIPKVLDSHKAQMPKGVFKTSGLYMIFVQFAISKFRRLNLWGNGC